MADKKITLFIEGQEVVCNFGVNYFYKHFKEVSGRDMLVNGMEGLATSRLFEILPHLFYSAYLAHCSLLEVDPILKLKDFERLILSNDDKYANKLLVDYFLINGIDITKTEDEKKTQMELQAASP